MSVALNTRRPPRRQPGQGRGPRTVNGLALDVRSVSALCGWSEKATRAMIERRLIPFRRLGGRIVFLRSELDAWLQALPGCAPGEARRNAEERRL